jgi:FtsZ-binding cell division protein ZapB
MEDIHLFEDQPVIKLTTERKVSNRVHQPQQGDQDNRMGDDDLLVEVAEQLRQRIHGWQEATHLLGLGEVRDMLEAALVTTRARLVRKTPTGKSS